MSTLVFALPGNETLADALARQLGIGRGELQCGRFADGETRLRFLTPLDGATVVLACTLDRPDDKLVALYLAASTARELGARRVLLVAPYLPYLRQDRRFSPGEGISAVHLARLLSLIFDGLVTVEPHLHRIRSLGDLYRMPVRSVQAAPAIAEWLRREVEQPLLIGPDEESEQWVAAVAAAAACPYRVLRKQRFGDRDVRVDGIDLRAVTDRMPVLLDDIIATARTQIAAIGVLRGSGMAAPVCIGVHALFVGAAQGELERAGAARIASCNTVAHASNCIDLRPAIAGALAELLAQAQ